MPKLEHIFLIDLQVQCTTSCCYYDWRSPWTWLVWSSGTLMWQYIGPPPPKEALDKLQETSIAVILGKGVKEHNFHMIFVFCRIPQARVTWLAAFSDTSAFTYVTARFRGCSRDTRRDPDQQPSFVRLLSLV